MAKMINCVFCGKELPNSFLSCEVKLLNVGDSAAQLHCCDECMKKYKHDAKLEKKRFGIKVDNIKKTNRQKLTEKEVADMFVSYLNERDIQFEKYGSQVPEYFSGFFVYNSNGCFSVKEFGKGFLKQDINAKSMVKSIEKSKNDDYCCFDKNDITKIEYAKLGAGDPIGLTKAAFSYAIRLNDESTMTYKPCITRTAVLGSGFGFGYRKSAEKKLLKELNEFKKQIGSDLPIVKVKNI